MLRLNLWSLLLVPIYGTSSLGYQTYEPNRPTCSKMPANFLFEDTGSKIVPGRSSSMCSTTCCYTICTGWHIMNATAQHTPHMLCWLNSMEIYDNYGRQEQHSSRRGATYQEEAKDFKCVCVCVFVQPLLLFECRWWLMMII